MKIVLHVGQAKTGTTAIQRAFRQNDKELLRQGFLYPICKGGVSHALLTVPILGRVQRSLAARIGADYAAGLEISKQSWEQIGAEIRSKAPDAVIISSEFLFSAPHIDRIPSLIEKYFGSIVDLEFLVYMRTPSDYYVSAMQQKLKASHKIPPIGNLRLNQLKRFADMGKVTVRKFDRHELVGGDAILDACSVLGIDSNKFNQKNQRESNASISAEGIILLQRYREAHHADRDNIFTEDTKAFLSKIIMEEKSHPGLYTRPMLKVEFAQALDRETPEMKSIRTLYGVDLSKDYGISVANERRIRGACSVIELIEYDPALLERMEQACGNSSSVL